MGQEIVTEYGVITINKDVIATLAGIAATSCFGIVGMVSSRMISDGISDLLGKEALSKGVDVTIQGDHLIIRVSIVVGYGNNISIIANNVVEKIKYTVETHTGLIVDRVDVRIQGVRVID